MAGITNPQMARDLRSLWPTRLGAPAPTASIPMQLPLTQALPTLGYEPLNSLPSVATQAPQVMQARGLGSLMTGPAGPANLPRINTAELFGPAPQQQLGSLMRGPAGPSLPQAPPTLETLRVGYTPTPTGAASSYPLATPPPASGPASTYVSGLPAPPASAYATPLEQQSLAQMGRGALSGMSGSFWPGATGLKGLGANALASAGIQYGGNAIANALGGQNTSNGRLASAATTGAGYGAIGGPKFAAALGATNLSMQAGAEKRKVAEEKGLGGLISQQTQPKSFSDIPLAALDAATLPFTAPLQAIGAAAGGSLGDLPVIGGLFGGPTNTEEQTQADTTPRDYSFNSIAQTATAMGLPENAIGDLQRQYDSTVAYMKGNPTISIVDPKTGQIDAQAKKDFEDAGYKVSDKGDVQVDDAYIQNAAWQQAYQALPTLQQQVTDNAEFARRQAALQAELVKLIPQITGGWYDTAYNGYGALGDAFPQYAANQQEIAGRMGDAVTAQLMNLPAYLALNAQTDRTNAIANQIAQAQTQQALAQSYPDLFGQASGGSTDQNQALLDALGASQ